MSTKNKITIRVQSPDGVKRIELDLRKEDSFYSLNQKVMKEFSIGESANEWGLYLDRTKRKLLQPQRAKSVTSILRHGDIIYLLPEQTSNQMETSDGTLTSASMSNSNIVEDDVDTFLSKQDGRIERAPDQQLCHHGAQAKCMNCASLEPYDLDYLKNHDPPIKYMSFHAYIKKLQSGVDRGKYVQLENLNCKIKSGCKEHPPWPKGICNKCQPPTIYLNRQVYRHVDNVMFENPQIVERFLDYWRKSGHQRVGFMYGRYETHDQVPLGIKATVSAIYEPPQETTYASVKLLADQYEDKINAIAKKLGLTRVGWIFTDLEHDTSKKGTVAHFRGSADTYFLSAEESLTAAYFQNKCTNACRLAHEGHFGSKFVTVVATGDSNHQIHFDAYQVSNQCMALQRDKCIVPTYDAPELAYIKETTNEQFVPDVYFREKDSYGNEVTKMARPLPVEYLLVDLPAAFSKDPIYRFNENSSLIKSPFPIENRLSVGQTQDFNALSVYLAQFNKHCFLEALSDFHLLVYLAIQDTVVFDGVFDPLLKAICDKDEHSAKEWSQTPEWQTIEQIVHMHRAQDFSHETMQTGNEWSCKVCTFRNPSHLNLCSMCQTNK